MRAKFLMALLVIILAAFLAIAPNALWLDRSSVLLRNAASEPLSFRIILSDDPNRTTEIGTLDPGATRFLWIDPIGEATLAVEASDGGDWYNHCTEYVEQGMYRVEITARSVTDVTCDTDLPITSHLLILDYLS